MRRLSRRSRGGRRRAFPLLREPRLRRGWGLGIGGAGTLLRYVGQDRFDRVRRNLELFRDFGDAHAIVETIYDCIDGQPRAAYYGGPLWTAGLTSTSRHSDQSIFSWVAVQ